MNTPVPIPPIPTPDSQPSGWMPTSSTLGGAILGGALSQIICAVIEQFSHATISTVTAGAISTVCVFAVGYLFKDGGRK